MIYLASSVFYHELETILGAFSTLAGAVHPDAATERILDRMGMHEHTQRDWDKAYELALAALGITEDTKKQWGLGPGLDPVTAYEQDEG